jgi:hypothetical protein
MECICNCIALSLYVTRQEAFQTLSCIQVQDNILRVAWYQPITHGNEVLETISQSGILQILHSKSHDAATLISPARLPT